MYQFKSLIQIIVLLLFLSTFSNPIQADDFTNPIGLDLLLEDNETVNATQDLNKLWVGATSDHMVFLVSFYNELGLGASVNITLRDTLGTIYLIHAYVENDTYGLSITEAVEMTNITKKESSSINIQYITQQIFFDSFHKELGFYIDYVDIGGSQPFDMIVFTGYPDRTGSDRLPDATTISFSDVGTIDREFDVEEAILGNFDINHPYGESSISPTTSTSQNTVSNQTLTVNPPSNSFLSGFLPVIGVIVILTLPFMFIYLKGNKETEIFDATPSKQDNSVKPSKSPPSFLQKTETKVQLKFMEELNREVRMCCYQTARLNETYCYCGRAVADDLKSLFDDDSETND